MSVFRKICIVMIFVCLLVGFVLVLFNKLFVSKKKNTEQVRFHKQVKIKLIGYIFMMLAVAFAVFQGLLR